MITFDYQNYLQQKRVCLMRTLSLCKSVDRKTVILLISFMLRYPPCPFTLDFKQVKLYNCF